MPPRRSVILLATCSSPGTAQPCRHFQAEGPPPASRGLGGKQYAVGTESSLCCTGTVASAQAQAQAQGRIYGAEARRASIDGQITRQGPVGREGRQRRSHSGPLYWRPQKEGRGSPHGHGHHGQPAIQPNMSPFTLVISDNIASRPISGQQSRTRGIRSETWVGTAIIGTGRPGDARKENLAASNLGELASQMPRSTVTWIMDRRSPWHNPPMKSPVHP